MLKRKNILLVMLLFSAVPAISQVTLGIKVSPYLSTNRVEASSDTHAFSSNSTGLRFSVGPIADFEFRENYFFSTGLLFASRRIGVEASEPTAAYQETYGVQYLQVPLTLKLFTNEVGLDKKIYFQLGGSLDFNINEKAKDDNSRIINDFLFFDAGLLVGFGLEYKVGLNTKVFGGFTYHRGLINAVNKHNESMASDLSIKNDYIGLDLGIKF